MSEDDDRRIQAIRAEVAQQQETMDALVESFVAETIGVIEQWAPTKARELYLQQAQQPQGPPDAERVKVELRSFLTALQKTARTRLGSREVWHHHKGIEGFKQGEMASYETTSRRGHVEPPRIVQTAISDVLRSFVASLRSAGVEAPSPEELASSIKFTNGMSQTVAKYAVALNEFRQPLFQLDGLELEKRRAAAVAAWDEH